MSSLKPLILAGVALALQAPVAGAADSVPAAAQAVASGAAAATGSYDGVVQAVRETVIAAQVPGAVVALQVKAGDTVRAGQVLLRLDARAAEQAASASAAQVVAARATQDAATREFERQKKLHDKRYISDAALERAEAQYKAASAGADAQVASANAARTQSGFYVVKAPYDGIVADVPVVLGAMAMPGTPLLTMYDPKALRVSVPVPQRVAAKLQKSQPLQVDLSGAALVSGQRWQLLPHVDASTHTVELRIELPAGVSASPGMFARVMLPSDSGTQARLFIPTSAVVRRAELTGVYVLGADNRPLLRQVRLGRVDGGKVEVLSGLSAADKVVADAQAAAPRR